MIKDSNSSLDSTLFSNKKSQAALEFILITGFLLTVGLVILAISAYFLLDMNDVELDIEREVFMESIKDEFELALTSDTSFYREIELSPEDMKKFDLDFYENTSYITIKDLIKGNDFPYLYDMGFGFRFNETFFYEENITDKSSKIIINLQKNRDINKIDVEEFIFFVENFNQFGGWFNSTLGTPPNNGEIQKSNEQAKFGTFSLKKTSNNDPAGGYKELGFTVQRNYKLEYWAFSEEDPITGRIGGLNDRVSIVDSSFNGYGALITPTYFAVERRDAGTATTISSQISWTRPSNTWYRVVFETINTDKFKIAVYLEDGLLVGEVVSNSDTTFNSFSRIGVHGGQNYFLDGINIAIKLN